MNTIYVYIIIAIVILVYLVMDEAKRENMDATEAIQTISTMYNNNLLITNGIQLGDKMRIVSGKDHVTNDTWLRVMNSAGTGYGPGVAVSSLHSEGDIGAQNITSRGNITGVNVNSGTLNAEQLVTKSIDLPPSETQSKIGKYTMINGFLMRERNGRSYNGCDYGEFPTSTDTIDCAKKCLEKFPLTNYAQRSTSGKCWCKWSGCGVNDNKEFATIDIV
jgi:hypothetical protein